MIGFIRLLFESALKTNPSLEFSVITGCLRISQEIIFAGLNNLKIISILDDRYAEHFGFTDDEVIKICEDYNMQQKYETIKQWFNGYIFGETNVYNPWSVMQYVDDLKANINRLLLDTISFNDAYENFYHRFLAAVLSNMKGYIVKSNRDGGTGRSDLFIKSVSRRGIAIVVEFKIANYIDDLEKKADEAIEQIEDRK